MIQWKTKVLNNIVLHCTIRWLEYIDITRVLCVHFDTFAFYIKAIYIYYQYLEICNSIGFFHITF